MRSLWLAAHYHFPSTYTIRVPMSSTSHALAMPAPGPATIRLALIRVGIERFGARCVQEEIFPWLSKASIAICPPARVAISSHCFRAYKWEQEKKQRKTVVQETLMHREMAHANGEMGIYIQIPEMEEQRCRILFEMIGYWGQSESLACCRRVLPSVPPTGNYALPLTLIQKDLPLRPYFTCFATEFRDSPISWQEILMQQGRQKEPFLQLAIYVWPLIQVFDHSGKKLFVHAPLAKGEEKAVR